jgi:hypothetical protein
MWVPFGVILQPSPGISVSQRTVSRGEGAIDSTVRLVILSRMAPPSRLRRRRPASGSLVSGQLSSRGQQGLDGRSGDIGA